MKFYRRSFWLFLLFFVHTQVFSGEQKFANLGDLKLESGRVIKNCQIGFRTFGHLNEKGDNAILFPTWFGGTSEHLGKIIGPNGLIDSTDYFIIAVDALGNGVSSSPSNSKEQPHLKFPQFTIGDMVYAQYRLLTEKLGIQHLYAIIGGSMGGMQTFEWIVRYPLFMDKAIPYVGTPKISSYGYLFWKQALNILMVGWRYHVPQDSIRGLLQALTALNMRTPQWVVEHWDLKTTDEQFEHFFSGEPRIFTNENFAYQIQALLTHDVSKITGGDWQKVSKRVKADVLVIVSKTDHMVNPANAIQFAQTIHAQIVELDDPCGHLAIGCKLKKVAKIIAHFLGKKI